ncbi:MAG: hypothetical protein ACAI35_04880 [Candidatus Methylacidiphilales bacterium]|nr:hypothetical protein [Candidatus Methylacidiphilales bacterium]
MLPPFIRTALPAGPARIILLCMALSFFAATLNLPAHAETTPMALSPAPASVPPKGQKPDSNIEIAGPDNGGEAQLYKLPGDVRVVTGIIRLSGKVVTAKSYFAKDGSGWIAYEEKSYFYDMKKGTLDMSKFGDKNTANLTFDAEKRMTTAAIAGDSFTAKKPAPDAEALKSLEQQLTDAATEARQFTANTLLPYMEAHKTGTLTLED